MASWWRALDADRTGAITFAVQPFSAARRERRVQGLKLMSLAEAHLFAATRPPRIDVVTSRVEPLDQTIF